MNIRIFCLFAYCCLWSIFLPCFFFRTFLRYGGLFVGQFHSVSASYTKYDHSLCLYVYLFVCIDIEADAVALLYVQMNVYLSGLQSFPLVQKKFKPDVQSLRLLCFVCYVFVFGVHYCYFFQILALLHTVRFVSVFLLHVGVIDSIYRLRCVSYGSSQA